MKRFALAAVAASLAGPAIASDCPAIDDDLDRLACYDKAAGLSPQIQVESNWQTHSFPNAFSGKEDFIASLEANEMINCDRTALRTPVYLNATCKEGNTSFYISTQCYLTSHGEHGWVRYKFGEVAEGRLKLSASNDNSALGYWTPIEAQSLLKKISRSNEAIFAFTPFSQSTVTVKFDTTHMTDALSDIRAACNW